VLATLKMKTAIIFLIFCATFLVSVQGHRELDDRRPTQNAHKKKPTTVEKIAKDELKVLRAPQAYGNVVIQNQGKLCKYTNSEKFSEINLK